MKLPESETDIEAWREAHKTLMEAVIVAREAVTAAKSQRRYWLEEIYSNLNSEGKLTASSIWKKPMKQVKRKTPAKINRKKSDDTDTDDDIPPIKKPKKVSRLEKSPPPKKQKIKIKLSKPPSPVEDDDDDDDDDENDDVDDKRTTDEADYSQNEHAAAAALLGGVGCDMSHIPAELRAFVTSEEVTFSPPVAPSRLKPLNPYATTAGKSLHAFHNDDDDDEDEEEEDEENDVEEDDEEEEDDDDTDDE